jgi:menaquinol-cytochrome c reductase iron-sulfur subunit
MKSWKLFGKGKEKSKTQAQSEVMETRRSLLQKVGLGALLTGVFGQGYAFLRSLVPNVLYEPSLRFKAGSPDQFAEGATFLEDKRVFIFRERNTFYAISAACTHLGCTVKMVNLNQPKKAQIKGQSVEVRQEFHCPCHGSKYYGDGTNFAGPAPTPLVWFKLELAAEDGQLVVNMSESVAQNFRLTV